MKKSLKSFFKGFSLVELMISLITISLISAAFAPIITKKLSTMGVTVGSFGGNGGGGGSEPNSCPSSAKCDPGYYLDGTCKCQPCSDPNCVVCSSANYCTTCNSDYEPDGNGVCQSKACLNSKFDDGTTGKPSKGCCESVGAVFVPASVTGTKDLCMMKYNAVDELYGYHPNYPKNGVF